jgi:hypothetical protein
VNEKVELIEGAVHCLVLESPVPLYIAAVHIPCLTFYILIPFSDETCHFVYDKTRRAVKPFILFNRRQETVVLISTFSFFFFASQFVRIQIRSTLKMETASCSELLVEHYV